MDSAGKCEDCGLVTSGWASCEPDGTVVFICEACGGQILKGGNNGYDQCDQT